MKKDINIEKMIKDELSKINGYAIKERASAIRKIYKTLGYNSKVISVRISHGTSINITIKDMNINIKQIENIANNFENIHRDEFSGEILLGGNIYVFVNYDSSIRNEVYKKIEPIADTLKANEGKTFKAITGEELWLTKDSVGILTKDDDIKAYPRYILKEALVSMILFDNMISLDGMMSIR